MTGEALAAEDREQTDHSFGSSIFPPDVEAQVIAYLRKLGLRDQDLISHLGEACLHRASRRAAPGAHHELLRRALEEAQRRFDHALALSLSLQGTKNQHALAAARAALLLGNTALESEKFLHAQGDMRGEAGSLLQATPQATPPESRLPMHEQEFSFFFTRSSATRK